MTAQYKDLIVLPRKDKTTSDYRLLNIEEGNLFNLSDYNLIPSDKYSISACDKKYYAEYGMKDSTIILKNLYINQEPQNHTVINNVKAEKNECIYDVIHTGNKDALEKDKVPKSLFNTVYRNVNIHLSDFSGSIILGKVGENTDSAGFSSIDNLDMWKKEYERVIRVVLHNKHIEDFYEL